MDIQQIEDKAYELLESEASPEMTEGEKKMFIQGCLQMATFLLSNNTTNNE